MHIQPNTPQRIQQPPNERGHNIQPDHQVLRRVLFPENAPYTTPNRTLNRIALEALNGQRPDSPISRLNPQDFV